MTTSFSASGVVHGRSVPDVMGYGVNIYSSTERRCNNQAFYERMSGTSMAAPYVTGLAARGRSRADVYREGVEANARFRDSLLEYLKAHHLLGAVRWMSEPGSLPLVTLHCQERVLEQLKRAPEFEAGRGMSLELRA